MSELRSVVPEQKLSLVDRFKKAAKVSAAFVALTAVAVACGGEDTTVPEGVAKLKADAISLCKTEANNKTAEKYPSVEQVKEKIKKEGIDENLKTNPVYDAAHYDQKAVEAFRTTSEIDCMNREFYSHAGTAPATTTSVAPVTTTTR